MSDELLSVIDSFVAKAQKLGADEVELFAHRNKQKTVNFEANNLKSAVSTIIEGVGIRILKNKSLGFASVNTFNKTKIGDALKEAFSIAKVSPPEDNYFLPQKQPTSQVANIFDEEISNVSMDDVVSYSNKLLKTTRKIDSRISIDSGNFETTEGYYAIVNSNGINTSDKKSALSYGLFGMAIDGADIGSFDYEFDSVINVADVDLQKTAKEFSQKLLQNLNAQKIDSFEGPAIFTPDAAQLIFGLIIEGAKATNIQSGSSYLQDKLGDKIAVDGVTLVDDGTIKNSPGSRSFDREGVPHKKLNIVEKGTFTGVFYDTFSANKENLQSTGHAGGGFRKIPNLSTTNLKITPGKKSIDDIIPEIKKGIIIQRISTFPDPVSGDYSGAVKGGRLIKNGEITDTLKEITAVGNVFTNLKSITHLSKELKPFRGTPSWYVPYVAIDNIKFVS